MNFLIFCETCGMRIEHSNSGKQPYEVEHVSDHVHVVAMKPIDVDYE